MEIKWKRAVPEPQTAHPIFCLSRYPLFLQMSEMARLRAEYDAKIALVEETFALRENALQVESGLGCVAPRALCCSVQSLPPRLTWQARRRCTGVFWKAGCPRRKTSREGSSLLALPLSLGARARSELPLLLDWRLQVAFAVPAEGSRAEQRGGRANAGSCRATRPGHFRLSSTRTRPQLATWGPCCVKGFQLSLGGPAGGGWESLAALELHSPTSATGGSISRNFK